MRHAETQFRIETPIGWLGLHWRGEILTGIDLDPPPVDRQPPPGCERPHPPQAILRQLSEAIGETCGLAIPDGLDMLYFDRVQTNWPLQINLPIGSHTPPEIALSLMAQIVALKNGQVAPSRSPQQVQTA